MPDLGLESHQCLHLSKNVDKNGSAAKRLAGVALEMNLRDPLHTGDKECKRGFHPGFETQGRHHQQSKNIGISGPTFFFKKRSLVPLHCSPFGKSWIRHYIRNKNSDF